MMRWLTDEDLDGRLIRLLCRMCPGIDLERAVDVGLGSRPDPEVLEWSARDGRILLTHDRTTMTEFAYDRVRRGLPMAGVVVVPRKQSMVQVVEDIVLLIEATLPEEMNGRVQFLPL